MQASFAQNPSTSGAELKCLAYVDSSRFYIDKNLDLALAYADSSYALIDQNTPDSTHTDVLINLGVVYVEIPDMEKALEYYLKARKIIQERHSRNPDDPQIALEELDLLVKIGILNYHQGNYDKSLAQYEEALNGLEEILEKVSDDAVNTRKIKLFNNIAGIYINNSDYDTALGYYQNAGGEIIGSVPFGEYSYSITTPCYETVTGEVTVDCNEGQGVMVAENPANATTNDVFFFIGSPLTISGATVTLSDGADFNESLITGAPFGDIMYGVPYGEYTYTIEAFCYETIIGTITVDCNDGMGTIVEQTPAEIVIDNSISFNEGTLNAMASGYSYQWIDCDNVNEEIEGETSQTFTPTADGNYAVIISNENCSITSECTSVVVSGISDNQPSINVSVYPNPTSTDLKVQIESNSGKAAVKVMTVTGQILLNKSFPASEMITLNVSDLAPGMYILNVANNKGQFVTPIVKQ